jgi:GR25 family glycosyltransferase involved in LPS biosynthesis
MSFQTYIVNWNEVESNVKDIERNFTELNQSFKIINSGTSVNENWMNVGDIRYYRQLRVAVQDFNKSDKEYMLFLCGDVSSSNWNFVLNRAEYVFNSYSPALYAPHLTHEPWSANSSQIGTMSVDRNLLLSCQTDGIMVFMHKEITRHIENYFDYLETQVDITELKSGWGMDMIWCSLAIYLNKVIIRDTRYIPNHPAGSSYDHGRAGQELNIILENFYKYCNTIDIDSEKIKDIHGKIYGRMNQEPNCMNVLDFYNSVPSYIKKGFQPNYYTIYINDDRKVNRDAIDAVVKGNKVNLKALNGRDPKDVEAFMLENPEFKMPWQSPKPGELGNFGSHYRAWKYAKENNTALLIFEDDAIIHSFFMDTLNIAMNNVPEDYDVLSIYVDENQYERYNNSEYINEFISKGYQDWSTLCYVISPQGAQKLCDYVSTTGFDAPTDWFIFRKGHAGIFNVYTLMPLTVRPIEIDGTYQSQVQ